MKKTNHKTGRKTRVQAADSHSEMRSPEDSLSKTCACVPESERLESNSSNAKKARARGKKPVRIGDALRQRGFDEHTIADHYVDVTHRLKGKSDKSGGVEKLLVDVLKECSKYLEPARPLERTDERAASRGSVLHVHLVHNVTRPARAAREDSLNTTGFAVGVSSGATNVSESANESERGATADVADDHGPVSTDAESASVSDFSL